MKRIFKISALAMILMLFTSQQNKISAQFSAGISISYQTFYDELSPYGSWIDYPEYGYVWIPDAGPDFRPYSSNGYWVWTDEYGWMWASDYDWGWAPFHYGRWLYDPFYGWVWVPDYEWSPAWVVWRHGGDYYGWAPLRPGISINLFFAIRSYSPPYDYWCFAPSRHITSRNLFNYCVDRRQNITIINNTTIINNYNYNRNIYTTGPRRHDAERYTGRINPVRFRESSRPGRNAFRNNEVVVYRPQVQRDDNRRFSPRNFERYDRRVGRNENNNGNNRWTDRNRNNGFDWNTDRNDRRNSRPFNNRRDDNTMRQQDRRQFENNRQDRNNGNRLERNNGRDDIRKENPFIRPNGDRNEKNRTFERRSPSNQNRNFSNRDNAPIRQQKPGIRNDNPNQRQPSRQFERRDNGNQNGRRNDGIRGINDNNGRGNGRGKHG